MKTIKTQIKRFCSWFYLRHSKLYTMLILIIGILLGCMYEGQDIEGTHYFKILDKVLYIGVQNERIH